MTLTNDLFTILIFVIILFLMSAVSFGYAIGYNIGGRKGYRVGRVDGFKAGAVYRVEGYQEER